MEILQSFVTHYRELKVGDSWEIGNQTTLIIKEIIRIEGQEYVCLSINNTPTIVRGRDKETKEITYELLQNRRFILAEQFVLENDKLFRS